MLSFLNQQLLIAVLVMVSMSALVILLVVPMFEGRKLRSRVKGVASEKSQLRQKYRSEMGIGDTGGRSKLLESAPKYFEKIAKRLKLEEWLADEVTTSKLRQAGFRGSAPLYVYLTMRLLAPPIIFLLALFYLFIVLNIDMNPLGKLFFSAGLGLLGFYAPNLYLKNRTTKRQTILRRSWPDALDLLLICVESGISVELGLKRVADEIGVQSKDLSDELELTVAELSYLGDRSQAFNNLVSRTGIDSIKNTVMALNQAERYGTPVGQALRVMADENRAGRLQAAEKMAAALPPKLTVPMILFFLPVIFAIVLSPVILQVSDMF